MSGTAASPAVRPPVSDRLMVLMIAGAGVLTQFLTMVSGVVAARMLGVDGRGQVVLISTLPGLASQLTLGGSLPNVVTKQLAARGVTARDGLRGMLGRWFAWSVLISVAAAGYYVFLERHRITTTTWLLAGGVVVLSISGIASRILIGAMLGEGTKPINIAMTGILPQFAVAAILTVAFVAGARWNVFQIVLVMVLCGSLILLARLRVLARPTGRAEDQLDRREMVRQARHTHIGSVGPIDGLALDRTMVGSLMGNVQLGLYSAAIALGSLATMLGLTVAMVALPKLAVVQGQPEEERRTVRRWVLAGAVLMVLTTIAFELVTPFAIKLLFGNEFSAAVPCAYWLVAASGLLGFRRVLVAVLQARDRGRAASWIEFALTPILVAGIAVSASMDNVQLVGVTMFVVAMLGCAAHGTAILRFGQRVLPVPDPEEAAAVEIETGSVVAG